MELDFVDIALGVFMGGAGLFCWICAAREIHAKGTGDASWVAISGFVIPLIVLFLNLMALGTD